MTRRSTVAAHPAIVGLMRGNPDVKRFYMPGVKIAIDCECGRRVERDLGDHYLSYPKIGEPFEEIVYCHDCGRETPVCVRLDVALSLEGPEATAQERIIAAQANLIGHLEDELRKPIKAKLTVVELAKALSEAFEADSWGDIDPYLFKEVIEPVEDSDHKRDAEGLRETLQRAVDKLAEHGGAL